MSEPRAIGIFLADAHLDLEPWVGRPIYGDSCLAFRYVIETAIARQVKAVIAAGDLADVRRPPSAVVRFIRNQMQRLQTRQIDFAFIQGQHEQADPAWFSAIHPHPTHLHKTVVQIGDYRVGGLDWTPADKLSQELDGLERCDILVMHQVWEEFMGAVTSPEGSLTQIMQAPVVVTGDYHHYEARKIRSGKYPLTVYSPGATHRRAINEPDEHYMLLLYEDGKMTRKRIPGRFKYRVDATDLEAWARFPSEWKEKQQNPPEEQRKLHEDLRTPLLEIACYSDQKTSLRKEVREFVKNTAHIFWSVKRRVSDQQQEQILLGQKLRAKGPAGCLPVLVPQDDPRHKPLLRLITSSDPKAELFAMKRERQLV